MIISILFLFFLGRLTAKEFCCLLIAQIHLYSYALICLRMKIAMTGNYLIFFYFDTSHMVVIYNIVCLQPRKDLMLKTSTMRRGLELGLWSRKQSMPPPSSGIRLQERVGKVVKSCLLKSRTCMMRRNCRLWMLSVKHLYWRSYCLQSTMIIIWCSGVCFFFCSTISSVDECVWFWFRFYYMVIDKQNLFIKKYRKRDTFLKGKMDYLDYKQYVHGCILLLD